MIKEFEWWKKTVVYQIYPRSYIDSTGNGIGDLQGIINKLDYIKDLGVETIWFSPFYPSPTDKPYSEHDCGYDISNYRDVNPEYGTMSTVDKLIEEIHARDMKIVLDMVLNHTSIEHPWFLESRSSKDNPKRNWYIWLDGKKPNGKKPPNNWKAMIRGSAWEYDELTKQWYYHAFLPFQPDLNYRNPEVQKEMLDTVRFWLKKGVDGYRLDIINALFEDAEFRNSPFVFKLYTEDLDILFRSSKRIYNHPDTLEFCKKLRVTIDEFPDKFMVGEVAASLATLKKYLGEVNPEGTKHDGLNLIFLFKTLTTTFKVKKLKKLIEYYEKWFPYPYTPTWVYGNHDQMRRMSRLGNSIEKAKLSALLQLTVRGVPFIYYGEEIGMINGKTKKKESRDAVSHRLNWIPQFIRNLGEKMGLMINRDGCRTPMQWDDSDNAGFSPPGVKTWLPINKDYKKVNVKKEEKNDSSLLNCYKRLLKVRKENKVLQIGDIETLNLKSYQKKILSYKRLLESEEIIVYINLTNEIIIFDSPLNAPDLIFSTLQNRIALKLEDNQISIYPYEGLIIK
ncbi:MAG: alpha-glucosidase [Promethearchaeota archaeon]